MGMTNVGNLLELRRIYSRGITGKGITTAVLDTGIYAHPDFFIPRNKIVYFQDFIRTRKGPFDDNGHGTHVSGIIAVSYTHLDVYKRQGYLSRIFKKYYKISVVDYIHLRKLLQAKYCLLYTSRCV